MRENTLECHRLYLRVRADPTEENLRLLWEASVPLARIYVLAILRKIRDRLPPEDAADAFVEVASRVVEAALDRPPPGRKRPVKPIEDMSGFLYFAASNEIRRIRTRRCRESNNYDIDLLIQQVTLERWQMVASPAEIEAAKLRKFERSGGSLMTIYCQEGDAMQTPEENATLGRTTKDDPRARLRARAMAEKKMTRRVADATRRAVERNAKNQEGSDVQ